MMMMMMMMMMIVMMIVMMHLICALISTKMMVMMRVIVVVDYRSPPPFSPLPSLSLFVSTGHRMRPRGSRHRCRRVGVPAALLPALPGHAGTLPPLLLSYDQIT